MPTALPACGRHLVAFCLAALLLLLPLATTSAPGADLRDIGYLDVTELGADPSGQTDSTNAIQRAVIEARDAELVAFFPPGEYLVSDTIDCVFESKDRACRLVGSVAEPGQRAVIRLIANAHGFEDADRPKVVVHLRRADESNADHYEQGFTGIDIVVGPGNPGAVGLRLQGAENTRIEDTTIDLSASGHSGIWGLPGSGGSTHRIRVIGGRVGINTYDARAIEGVEHRHPQNSQPTVVITGAVLEHQTEHAIKVDTRGPMVVVGARIVRDRPGPAILLRSKYHGDALSAQINLIDSVVEYPSASPSDAVVEMEQGGRSFIFENVYLRHTHAVYDGRTSADPSGWTRVRRLGHAQGNLPHELSEAPYVDGRPAEGEVYFDAEPTEKPPADLLAKHRWADDFPSFQSEGVVNVRAQFGAVGDGESDDTQALQSAINAAEVVFLPKGRYVISDTLRLKPNSKLIGVHSRLTRLITRDTHDQRFAGQSTSSEGIPMLELPDVPGGDVILASINVASSQPLAAHDPTNILSYPLKWQCRATFRDFDVRPHGQIHYHEQKVIDRYHGDEAYPDNGSYPDQMKYDVALRLFPLVLARGRAAGQWFNFYMHGDFSGEPESLLIRIEGTTEPISIYHFHCQQQQGSYFLHADRAQYVSIYGSKSEMTYGVARFTHCDHIHYFGHGGIGSPAPGNPRGIDWYFRFEDTPNFVIGGFAPQLSGPGRGKWVRHHGRYKAWWRGAWEDARMLVDEPQDGPSITLDKQATPILYLRGDPD